MFTSRNNFLKVEKRDDLRRHDEGPAAFRSISSRTGTISAITNLKASGEIIYQMLN